MGSFDEAWAAAAKTRDSVAVSEELRPLLKEVYKQTLSHPLDRTALKQSLESLLEYLAGNGRTNANCWATDIFFSISDGWEADWSEQELPEDFHDILVRMGEALHDAVKNRDLAENFGCLPEQLIESVHKIATN